MPAPNPAILLGISYLTRNRKLVKYKLLNLFICRAACPAPARKDIMLCLKVLMLLANGTRPPASMVFRFGFNLKTAARLATAASNLPQKNPNPLLKRSYV